MGTPKEKHTLALYSVLIMQCNGGGGVRNVCHLSEAKIMVDSSDGV